MVGDERAAAQTRFIDLRRVVQTWWPLALSWAMMGIEQPLIGAVVARLPDPTVQLAAFGSVVFPIALVVEAPVIMLLAASTELSRDRAAYRALARVGHGVGLGLTLLHLVMVATPLFDGVVAGVLDVPEPVREPARMGLVVMLPWTWAIASRRMNQGLLIRHGQSGAVGWGTGLRLVASASILLSGLAWSWASGSIVAAVALSVGVVVEAIYASWRARVVLRTMPESDPERPPLRGRAFWRFYIPLATTPLITLTILPVGTAAVSRMPAELPSLALWPIVNGLVFVLQALGLAVNEVVVALLDEPGARGPLRRFVGLLTVLVTALWALLSLTPLADLWFREVNGLSESLVAMGAATLWLALPIPGTRVMQSWFQGKLVSAHQTRGIIEAVCVFAVTCTTVMVIGVREAAWSGLSVAVVAFSTGRILQTLWLAWRARRL